MNRTNGRNSDSPSGIPNRQVSLANIATAFLTERKSSSRRQSSIRRKKRFTSKSGHSINISRQSSYTTNADDPLVQRFSTETMPTTTTTMLLVPNNSLAIPENKPRSSTVIS